MVFCYKNEKLIVSIGLNSNDETHIELADIKGKPLENKLISKKGQLPSERMVTQIGDNIYFFISNL